MSIVNQPWEIIGLGVTKDANRFKEILKSSGILADGSALKILHKLVEQSARHGCPDRIIIASPKELGMSTFCSFEGISEAAHHRGLNANKSIVEHEGASYILNIIDIGDCRLLTTTRYDREDDFWGLNHYFVFAPWYKI